MKENTIVYVEHEGIIKKCLLYQICRHENNKDKYLLKVVGGEQTFIADKQDLFETKESCEEAYRKRYDHEYKTYYDGFMTMEELFAYLLHAVMTRKYCNDIELAAAVNRASEFTKMDMLEYLEKYTADMQKLDKVTDF